MDARSGTFWAKGESPGGVDPPGKTKEKKRTCLNIVKACRKNWWGKKTSRSPHTKEGENEWPKKKRKQYRRISWDGK